MEVFRQSGEGINKITWSFKMKKIFCKLFFFLFTIFSVFFQTGCLTGNLFSNKKVNVPFYGTMDTRFGYEDLYWGITFDDASKLPGYPVKKCRYSAESVEYYYGEVYKFSDGNIYSEYYGHGSVNSTKLFFENDRLYKVVDDLEIKNPSLEYLHERYGEFSDENIVSKFKNSKLLSAIYTNENLFSDGNTKSLQIQIDKNGNTRVFIEAPYTEQTLLLNQDIANYLSGKEKLPANKWYMLGSTDGKNKNHNLIFLNRNEDNNYAVIYYKKNVDEVRSTLRVGISIGNGSTDGTYEIKTKDGMKEVRMGRQSYNFPIINFKTDFTDNNMVSAREMINLFLKNETLTFRKGGKVSTLQLAGLREILAKYGISFDELRFAISNEEF